MRYAARVDSNQSEIVAELRKIGAVVTPLHQHGQGVPDLLISYRQKWFLMECKTVGSGPNELQRRWIAEQQAPVLIATGPTEAIALLTAKEVFSGNVSSFAARMNICLGPVGEDREREVELPKKEGLASRVLGALRFAKRKMSSEELCVKVGASRVSNRLERALRTLIQKNLVMRDGPAGINNRQYFYWAVGEENGREDNPVEG